MFGKIFSAKRKELTIYDKIKEILGPFELDQDCIQLHEPIISTEKYNIYMRIWFRDGDPRIELHKVPVNVKYTNSLKYFDSIFELSNYERNLFLNQHRDVVENGISHIKQLMNNLDNSIYKI